MSNPVKISNAGVLDFCVSDHLLIVLVNVNKKMQHRSFHYDKFLNRVGKKSDLQEISKSLLF